ncbi:MAG: 3-phenylpropionate/trans-cinnamate dioxygenase ferredoxin reductase component [Microbacteriaceae bacterium]|nr:3-phenylpropionate/trans-cinnamate dioxygenase ferredoxin reductase component [Microbacteriaceae bacterium]
MLDGDYRADIRREFRDRTEVREGVKMATEREFIIVGAALAGASAAEELRGRGFDGSVRLLGSEEHRPYIRPPLSKGYLGGSEERETVFVHPGDWYAENRIELSIGATVAAIDRPNHEVELTTGERHRYDRLLLATGSSPRMLELPGADSGADLGATLDGVHYLRTLGDSDSLREALGGGGRMVVVIGSGWIGMEVAATARTLGNDVTILERGEIPLAKAIGDELGAVFAELHRQNGVVIRPGVEVEGLIGVASAAGRRVSGVALVGGEVVPADLVLVGIGARPNIRLASEAGLAVDDGILVDASLATSDPDIFAAGDIANAWHPVIGQRIRSEHWANALNQGPAAARSMLGEVVSFDDIPYFYTDQFDLGMEYSGFPPLARDAKLVYRGDRNAREFIAFWVLDGTVVAGMNVNVWDVNEQVQRIIRSANVVDPVRLADENVPLEEI